MTHARPVTRSLTACALGAAVALAACGGPAAQAAEPWSPATDCAACHESQVASVEGTAHQMLACIGCHSDEDALAKVHADVDESTRAPRRLKSTEVADATCLSCHGDGMLAEPQPADPAASEADAEKSGADAGRSDAAGATSSATAGESSTQDAEANEDLPGRTALVAAAADSTVLTDEDGTVVNPHDLPPVEDHTTIGCVSCHKGHADDALETSAMKTCALCHHENVFECYTCHE